MSKWMLIVAMMVVVSGAIAADEPVNPAIPHTGDVPVTVDQPAETTREEADNSKLQSKIDEAASNCDVAARP